MTPTAPAPTDPAGATPAITYRPAQQRVIDLLGRHHDDAPVIEPTLAEELRAELDERLEPVIDLLPNGDDLFVNKTQLSSHAACPGLWRARTESTFSWTIPAVRGTVSHKAIELTLNWRGEVEPARAVDAAVSHLLDDEYSSAGRYLRTLTTVDLAELRANSVEFVTAFEECFPPLKARWRPVIDGRSRAELCEGRIILGGRPDLTLGQALGGGKVIIDLKTGAPHRHHVDDLRFYALVDTLRVGLPPRRLATVYLDSGQPVAETVTTGVLEAAVERVVQTVTAMIESRWGTGPTPLRTGPSCGWCPARQTCTAGLEWAHLDTHEP